MLPGILSRAVKFAVEAASDHAEKADLGKEHKSKDMKSEIS